jgi:hypothetical protein
VAAAEPPPDVAAAMLAARLALGCQLAGPARDWLEAPALALTGRPANLPADTPEHPGADMPPPREWRLYGRRGLDPAAAFRLRAVLPDRPAEALVDAAFRAMLGRAPDPADHAAYARALDSGALNAGVLLRDIASSPEARAREETLRLVAAPLA